ncbi:MAG: diguanylate cyclase [Rhodocyclaceae bacterium]|nr:diguanylate cyclase [Rhodocyclaceae bacterium]
MRRGPFSEGSREYILQQSIALSRLIADTCTAVEAERAAHLPRLHALGDRISVANDELTHLCDSVVREWREWAAILGVAAPEGPNLRLWPNPRWRKMPRRPIWKRNRRSNCAYWWWMTIARSGLALRAMLEADGYAVSEAADGREGLRIALDMQPHMLVTDRVMPRMDGMEMTRTLRGTRLGRDLYILMLTALDEEDRLLEGYQAGVDDYLAKPLNPRMILARLRAGQRIVRLLEEREHDREELRRFAAELSISNRRLEEMALTDVLTGLPNRRHAMARIEQEWAASMRSRRPLSCMVIDLDQFKQVNDIYGHDVGDAYLTQVASAIRGAVRTHDVVARTGGDEFQVICPDTDLQAALACAERIRCAVEQSPIVAGARRLKACMSAGVAEREVSMPNADALIKRADEGVLSRQAAGAQSRRFIRKTGQPVEQKALNKISLKS